MLRVRHLLLPPLLLSAVAGLAVPAAVATAAPALPAYVTYIADHLRADPLFVSDDMAVSVPASALPRLRQVMSAAHGYAVYVILAPPDSQRTDPDTILSLVHGALDQPGVYVLSEGRDKVTAASYGVDADAKDAAEATFLDSGFDDSPVTMVERTLTLLATGNASERARYVVDHYDEISAARDRGPHHDLLMRLLAGFALGAFLLLLLRRLRKVSAARARRRTVAHAGGPAPTRRDTLEWLAGNNLRKLQRQLQTLPAGVSRERRDRAFDSAEAAALLLERPESAERERTCNLVAAVVLTRQGLDLAARNRGRDDGDVSRPCFFNPLHISRSTTPVHWQDGHHHDAQVPACTACADNLTRGRALDAFVVSIAHGAVAPWWEAGCAPLWTRTGFGALRDDLARQVLAELPSDAERRR